MKLGAFSDSGHCLRDYVGLTDAEIRQLFEELDRNDTDTSPDGSGKSRHGYRLRVPVSVDHANGVLSGFLVHIRRADENGAVFLHGAYLNIGARCMLALNGGATPPLKGIVVACRHVQGMLHETTVKFIDNQQAAGMLRNRQGAYSDIDGVPLYLDESELDRELFTYYTTHSQLRGLCLADVDQALKQYEALRPDLFLADVATCSDALESVLEAMGETVIEAGTFILVSADPRSPHLQRACARYPLTVLVKPFDVNEFYRIVGEGMAHAHTEHCALSAEDTDLPAGLVAKYVECLHDWAEELKKSAYGRMFGPTRDICVQLKGTGSSFGFPRITQSAVEALAMLDMTGNIHDSINELQSLIDLCHNSRPPLNTRRGLVSFQNVNDGGN